MAQTAEQQPVPAARTMTGMTARSTAGYGRGARDSPATNDIPITMRLAEPPTPLDLVRSA